MLYLIDIENNKTGIYNTIKEAVPLGRLYSTIGINPNTNITYLGGNTLSALDLYTTKIIANLSTAYGYGLAVNPNSSMVYVVNRDNNTVSVIDGLRNRLVTNILVGTVPTAVAVNPNTNLIYVTNSGSNTVSIIDGSVNKEMAGLRFTINLPNTGHIKCNNKVIRTNEYIRLPLGTQCTAEANNGFAFSSWTEDLGHSSSKTIPTFGISYSPFNSLLGALGLNPNSNSGPFNITGYGSFAANFEKIRPPIPP
jgi:YVTN family beta-propeller protein